MAECDKPPGKTLPRRAPGIPILLATFVLFDLAVAFIEVLGIPEAAGLVLGIIFAQVTLAAVWTSLASVSLFFRTTLGFLAVGLIAGALSLLVMRESGRSNGALLWFAAVLAQWAIIQLPLWVLRLAYGWHIADATESAEGDNRDSMQFGIRQLMTWTALVAVTLGVARWLVTNNAELARDSAEFAVIFGIILTCNSLLTWPVIWASLMRRRTSLWLVGAAGCCVVLTYAEIACFQVVRAGPVDDALLWMMNGIQATMAAVGLFVIRASGYCLHRRAATSH